MFDIYTIIFLALAVFIFVRLRSVLGQRTGNERPPYDPYTRDQVKPVPGRDKVVALPGRNNDASPQSAETDAPAGDRLGGIVPADSAAAAGLMEIAKREPGFDAAEFVGGAKAAYEMIVGAFAEGDRRTLKNLLAKDVFDGFATAIADRENRGETMESRFVSIDKAEITGAELKDRSAQVTVRFVSQLVSVTRDKEGKPIDGNPEAVTEVIDVWTFARELGTRDPNWKLVATETS